jgi:uncharacterized phage protein (TIGR01671 family)
MQQREIKFRAWDKVAQKWLFGYEMLGGFSLTGEVILCGELSSLPLDKSLHDVHITQSSELKDENGNEIYECDIIRTSRGRLGIVLYDYKNGQWLVKWIGDGSKTALLSSIKYESSIIGNIFENPEYPTSSILYY